MIKHLVVLFFLLVNLNNLFAIKVLHLSFHSGCLNDFKGVAKELGIEVTSLYIVQLEPYTFDPQSKGNVLYNIGHDRAERIFSHLKEYFDSFDVILTSDTSPLSRIFLQNGWEKPLIIWICNRFDYCDYASLDCEFPDQEYYDLFKKATHLPNVRIVAYTDFERYYCRCKGIEIGSLTIKPCIPVIAKNAYSSIPEDIEKSETFFLPPYHNETIFMNLEEHCQKLGIPCYCGRYNGPADLKGFKGIIHLPYSWSNLAFFENMQLELPYFVPSFEFVNKLEKNGQYFIPNSNYFFEKKQYKLSEWYCSDFKDIITYFDSWEDLVEKVVKVDYVSLHNKIKDKSIEHRKKTLQQWKELFESFKT